MNFFYLLAKIFGHCCQNCSLCPEEKFGEYVFSVKNTSDELELFSGHWHKFSASLSKLGRRIGGTFWGKFLFRAKVEFEKLKGLETKTFKFSCEISRQCCQNAFYRSRGIFFRKNLCLKGFIEVIIVSDGNNSAFGVMGKNNQQNFKNDILHVQ